MKKSNFFITALVLNTVFIFNNQVLANENIVPINVDTEDTWRLNMKSETEIGSLTYNISRNMLAANEIPSRLAFNDEYEPRLADVTSELVTKVNNDMVLKNGETLAAHSATLGNHSNIDQTLGTAIFEYTLADSVSTKNSHSAGAELTTTAEMKFPFASGSVSLKVKYDFNNTKEVTSSVTKKWTVPSQQIKIPAGHTYQVNWVIKTGVATGTTDLSSRVKAFIPYRWDDAVTDKTDFGNKESYYGYLNLSDAIKQEMRLEKMGNLPNKWRHSQNWEPENGDSALRNWGKSSYTAKIGTELVMNIIDITKTNGKTRAIPVLVESIPMDIVPTIVE